MVSNNEFVTHMLNEFTDKYGGTFASFFVEESIFGKYLGAKDLYNSHELQKANIIEIQSNFIRDFDKFVKIGREKNAEMQVKNNQLQDFFKSNRVKEERKSDKAYWETLFAYVYYKSRQFYFDPQEKLDSKYRTVLGSIISDELWYNESIMLSAVWSIEFFRLRLFIEDLSDESFEFTHMLDWFDIFEFRILPVALKMVKDKFCKGISLDNVFDAKAIIDVLNGKSDYPFSKRLGVNEQSKRKALWTIRKNMLPNINSMSDVNLSEDNRIFNDIAQIIKKKAGIISGPLEIKEHILVYTSERNRLRQGLKSNGTSYTYLMTLGTDLSVIDIECMDICISEFKALTANTDISDVQNIISVIGIHHLLYHEILEEEKDDFSHINLSTYKNDLEYVYSSFKKNILESIVYKYSEDKSLQMEISFNDSYKDELLSDMLMIGSEFLTKKSSDSLLRKIYEPNIKQDDYERNRFINKSWNSMDIDDRMICALHVNDVGLLERINCVDEQSLSLDEHKYVKELGMLWIEELNKIHTNLIFD